VEKFGVTISRNLKRVYVAKEIGSLEEVTRSGEFRRRWKLSRRH
jgi:hypothetical protein